MRVRRVEASDAVSRDGEIVLLLGGTVVRLSAIAATLYTLTDDAVDVEWLASQLESRFGAPEGRSALETTKDAVADLIRHGVLRQINES